MQLFQIFGSLLLAGIPAILVVLGSFYLPVDWFELREIGVIISYGAIILSVICYVFGIWIIFGSIKRLKPNFQMFLALALSLLSLCSFVLFLVGVSIWHSAGTHFVQNCGDFSILRYNGSGSTYHAYYSDGVQINSVADDCQTNSDNIKKVESCSVKPIFITKEFVEPPYTNIPQKIYFTANSNVRSLNSDNLTELINCLENNGLDIVSQDKLFCDNVDHTSILQADEKLLDRILFFRFAVPIIYNETTKNYYFLKDCVTPGKTQIF